MRFSALYDHAARRQGEQEQGFAALVSPEQKKRGSAITSENPGLCQLVDEKGDVWRSGKLT